MGSAVIEENNQLLGGNSNPVSEHPLGDYCSISAPRVMFCALLIKHISQKCVLHHLTFVCRVQRQQEEEKLQRMIQEEAVKFLWKQVSLNLCLSCT